MDFSNFLELVMLLFQHNSLYQSETNEICHHECETFLNFMLQILDKKNLRK